MKLPRELKEGETNAQSAHHAPDTLEQAASLLAANKGARPLSGGTDLIVQTQSGRIAPAAIVDLKRIASLREIREEAGHFAIGAAVPCTSLKKNAALVAEWPGVVEAANLIGSVQVRNRATDGRATCATPRRPPEAAAPPSWPPVRPRS